MYDIILYMDSKTGGLSLDAKQRQAAAEIARRKVLQAYDSTESVDKDELSAAVNFVKRQEAVANGSVAPAAQTQQPRTQKVLGTSATPVIRQVSNEEWKKYHSAWQNYYQKYYSDYYMKAAKDYVQKTQNLSENSSALQSAPKQGSDKELDVKSFKEKIQERAREKANLSRRRRLLTPLFAGLSVVIVILFLQYNRLIFAPIAAYVSPGDSPSSEISAVDPTVTLTKVSDENKLIIPKLNVDVPLHFGVDLSGVMYAMNFGVVHYRINGASALPGEIGNFVVTGHSAGDIYSSNQYKFIFSGLERLEPGDLIYVHYNSTRYTYKMVKNEVIEPTEVSKLIYETDKPMLTLITCWPLGTSRYRLLVTAEQISPSFEGATIADDDFHYEFPEEESLPENEKTFFAKIWDWLTGKD